MLVQAAFLLQRGLVPATLALLPPASIQCRGVGCCDKQPLVMGEGDVASPPLGTPISELETCSKPHEDSLHCSGVQYAAAVRAGDLQYSYLCCAACGLKDCKEEMGKVSTANVTPPVPGNRWHFPAAPSASADPGTAHPAAPADGSI